MKVGTVVVGVHVAALCAFALTQGCVTTESQGSGRGAGARHRGIVKHQHKGKISATPVAVESQGLYAPIEDDMASVYAPVIVESTVAPVESYRPPAANAGTYIVQKGDVLSKIASKCDTTTSTLVQMNNLTNPDVLYVGQELRVPGGNGGSSVAASNTSSSSITKGGTYTIQKGDTLSGIAVAAGVSLTDLRSLNHIQGDKIMAGEKLDIPSYGKVPSKTQKSKPKKKAAPTAEPMIDEPAMAPLAPSEPQVEPVESASMAVDMVEEKMLYPGETLDDVARQYGVSKSEIMRLNNIADESAVREGMTLRIPIAE